MRLARRAYEVLTQWLPVKPMRSRLRRPVASFTFDDFAHSAWSEAGPILEAEQAKGTYYVAGSRCGQTAEGVEQYTRDDLLAVAAAGHEIGCHTWSHRAASTLSTAELEADAGRNATFLRGVLGEVQLTSFAHPYGDVTPRTKLWYGRRFPCSRGVQHGINAGVLDLAQLAVVPLSEVEQQPRLLDELLDRAHAVNGWLIFFTHDVATPHEAYGCAPATLARALKACRTGGLEVLPVGQALALATGPS